MKIKRVIEIEERDIQEIIDYRNGEHRGQLRYEIVSNAFKAIAKSTPYNPTVETLQEIPKDFVYDTETEEFYVYRNKYTGKEIHIVKNPPAYILDKRPQGEWKHLGGDEWTCSECGHVITTEGSWENPLSTGAYHCENCGADMRGGAE